MGFSRSIMGFTSAFIGGFRVQIVENSEILELRGRFPIIENSVLLNSEIIEPNYCTDSIANTTANTKASVS